MDFSIDLRFLFLPLLNLIIFFLFLKSQDGNSWNVQDGASKILLYPILKLQLWFLIPVIVIPLLLFILTPIRVPLKVSRPISVSCGELSVLLAVSAVASVILAPSLFLVAYLCLIVLSFCYAMFASLFQHFFYWLRRLAVFIVTSVNAHLLAPPQVEQPIEQAQGVLEIIVM
ncbi:hypothetical protein WN944_026079 [Citrus x changshan-huyou]|uniref:Uncharacterized protein n=1 Tax=Citrus x changshan-huyou TaxID=2935761 RepID=A0AAP0QCX5_9ROSI